MAISAFVFRTKRKDLAVAAGKKTAFPLLDLLSVKGMSITLFCRCRIPAKSWVALGSDPILLAIVLALLCAAVIYAIKHHYLKKRGIDIGLASFEDRVLE